MTRVMVVNLALSLPFAAWLLLSRRFARAALLMLATFAAGLLWTLPPVPSIAALVIALSLRRGWKHSNP